MVVERDKPGGICLNVGCIPSKALINAAKYYDKLRHGADIGILADNIRVDMPKMQAWKGEVVSKLTGGVKVLLKANGCDYRTGSRAPAVAQHRRADRGRRQQGDDPGRQHRRRDRLAPDRDPGLQVRRQAHRRFDGRARRSTPSPSASSSSAAATSASRSARCTRSSARKVTVVEALPGDPDRQRPGHRPGGGAQAQEAGRRGDDRRQGEVVEREGRARRGRRRRRAAKTRRSTPTRCWSRSAAARTPRASGSRRSA